MGRWLSWAATVFTLIVICSGGLYWQHQLEEVEVSVENSDVLAEKAVLSKEEKKPEDQQQSSRNPSPSIDDIVLPFDKEYQQLISHYQKEMDAYLREAERTYHQSVLQGESAHHDIVDTYRKKADELEEHTELQFQRQLGKLKEELKHHGYDTSYTWEYEWALESLIESHRLEYIRTLLELDSLTD